MQSRKGVKGQRPLRLPHVIRRSSTPFRFLLPQKILQFAVHDGENQVAVGENRREGGLGNQVVHHVQRDDRLHEGNEREEHEADEQSAEEAERAARQAVELLEDGKAEHRLEQVQHDGEDNIQHQKADEKADDVDACLQNRLADVIGDGG